MPLNRAAQISIDLAALQHNFQQVKKYSPNSKVMPVIKANAYGHSMLQVAKSLSAADGFAVAQLEEAVSLREHGIDKSITVFQGFSNQLQLEQILQNNLRPAISQLWQLELLESYLKNNSLLKEKPLDTWLKINTGMGRLGVQPDDVEAAWQRLNNITNTGQMGLMMHFANADEPSHISNQLQIDCFCNFSDKYNTQISVSNSAAIISELFEQQDWVRPGIMLYGSSPLLNKSAKDLKLKPVMTLQAELIAINQLKKDHHVGYGDNWSCPEDMPVGIVNIGYGDGYPRHAPSGTPVAVNGQQTKLIGRVSMDSIAVDLRNIDAECGAIVELWGKQISVDEVALKSGTISYELLCNVGRIAT